MAGEAQDRSAWQRLVGVNDERIRESINGRIVSGQAAGAKPPRQLTPEERAAYEAELLAREAPKPPPPPVPTVPPERVRVVEVDERRVRHEDAVEQAAYEAELTGMDPQRAYEMELVAQPTPEEVDASRPAVHRNLATAYFPFLMRSTPMSKVEEARELAGEVRRLRDELRTAAGKLEELATEAEREVAELRNLAGEALAEAGGEPPAGARGTRRQPRPAPAKAPRPGPDLRSLAVGDALPLALAGSEGKGVRELAGELGVSEDTLRAAASRLVRAGQLRRVARGVFAVAA